MGFLPTILREILSVLKLDSEVEVSKLDKQKMLIRKALTILTVTTLVMMTYRLMIVSDEYAKYRKEHEELLETCKSKNNQDGPSDSGTGISLKDNWLKRGSTETTEVCLTSWC
jgi:hypothetical protein